jgi:hypothetical protein
MIVHSPHIYVQGAKYEDHEGFFLFKETRQALPFL